MEDYLEQPRHRGQELGHAPNDITDIDDSP